MDKFYTRAGQKKDILQESKYKLISVNQILAKVRLMVNNIKSYVKDFTLFVRLVGVMGMSFANFLDSLTFNHIKQQSHFSRCNGGCNYINDNK
ncbi:hypothetical protein CR513_22060, partial [Mucuna pruriens]